MSRALARRAGDLAAEKAVDMVTAAEGLPDDALRGAGAAKVAELA